MLSIIKQYFPTTKNEELAGMLGVGTSTMIRKARELGLEKDQEWLHNIRERHRLMANMMSRAKGYPGGFKKGVRNCPEGMFKKGRIVTDEEKAKKAASMRRWYLCHKSAASAKSLKAWETRRKNGTDYPTEEARRKMSEAQKRWHREHPGQNRRWGTKI